MSKLDWGSSSSHLYEHGVDRGILYPLDGAGIPWNGLLSIVENESGSEEVVRYYDGKKYRSQITEGEYAATVNCYTYPDILDTYEEINAGLSAGSRTGNTYFNFSYRTLGEKGYKLHLVYNVLAKSSSRPYSTIGGSTDAVDFSWDITTLPIPVPGARESAHIVIDSAIAYPWVVDSVEKILYGTEESEPRFPTVEEVISVFENGSVLKVTDLGNGLFRIDGPAEAIQQIGPNKYSISWPSVVQLDEHRYQITSL